MMNGTATAAAAGQRYAATDYRSYSRRHDAVSSTLGPPWYHHHDDDPRKRPTAAADPALLLDIPATSTGRREGLKPAGPAPPRPAPRGVGHGTGASQPLLTVDPPPPSQPHHHQQQQPAPAAAAPQMDDSSVISPQLRQAQKTGDLYNISVNLNALQLAARSVAVVPILVSTANGSAQKSAPEMTYLQKISVYPRIFCGEFAEF